MASKKLRLLSCLLSVSLLFLLPQVSVWAANNQQDSLLSDAVQVAVDELPVSFSPYASSPLTLQYAHLFFDPLVRWGGQQQLEKRLLEKWERIKPGVIRFYLKKNIKFHSGNELNSDDIIWTFSQILKVPQAKRFFEGINAIKPLGLYRFDLYSSLSERQLLDYLTHFFVLDADFYQASKINLNKAQNIISSQHEQLAISGTGPYQIKKYNPALALDVVSNKNYWQGEAAVKEINFIKINSADSRSFALLADDVGICEFVSNKMIDTINVVSSKQLVEVNPADVLFFTINQKNTELFKRETVREAINLAINKEGMLKHIFKSMGRVGTAYMPLDQVQRKVSVYDVGKAKALLAETKIPKELTLLVLSDKAGKIRQVAKALVNMMRRVGIKLTTTEVSDINEWNKHLFDYDFSVSLWSSTLMDKHNIYHALFADSTLSRYLSTLFREEKVGSFINEQALSFEQMQQTQKIIPLLFANKIWATDKKYNLADIFSVNGIPYWYLLSVNTD